MTYFSGDDFRSSLGALQNEVFSTTHMLNSDGPVTMNFDGLTGQWTINTKPQRSNDMGEGTYGGHEYKGRLFTRAQQVKGGWVGQIVLDGKDVVFEGKPKTTTGEGKDKVEGAQLALDEANAKLVEGFTKLFS